MWLDPTERHTIPEGDDFVWLSIKEEETFVLQQYQPHIDTNKEFLPVFPFRIILRATHLNILIAQEREFPTIIDHWEWLENNVFQQMKELNNDLPEDELFQFAILKISSLVKCSEITDASQLSDRTPDHFFRSIYPNYALIDCNFMNFLFQKNSHLKSII